MRVELRDDRADRAATDDRRAELEHRRRKLVAVASEGLGRCRRGRIQNLATVLRRVAVSVGRVAAVVDVESYMSETGVI